jgi:hypothetical protein
LPSARNSAARAFIAARSSALKPPDLPSAFFAGIPWVLSPRADIEYLSVFRSAG